MTEKGRSVEVVEGGQVMMFLIDIKVGTVLDDG